MMSGATMEPYSRMRPEREISRRIAAFAAGASLEISPRDDLARERIGDLLAPGTAVFVNHAGTSTHHDIVAACVRLRRAGFRPVPHIAARRLASFTQARDFLERATGEAGVSEVLMIAGDPAETLGPFRDTIELLTSGLAQRCAIRRVFFAGYPEGHPRIDRHALAAALRTKLALARENGLEVSLITQFGFEAEPIRSWIAALREDGIVCPVRVGVAGPASIATLAKFAVRCGIGASLRALGRGQTAFARILTEATPDPLIAALVENERPGATFDGLHLFTFGGLRRTALWLDSRSRPLGGEPAQ